MTAPKLRFDGFNSDWTLDSIGAVISNKSKKYDPEKSEMDFPCIELEHLSQQTGEILGTISAKDQKSIKNVFDENSVLFGKLRPYLRKFAKPNFQGVCSSEIWVLTSKKMQPNFLFQYVQTDGFSELTQIQAGSKMPRADWGSISNGEILFPIFEEQTKIASFLSAVDEKISQLTQKHQLLSQYKQGMMQKLFSQQIRFKADDGSEFGEWECIQANSIFENYSNKNHDGSLTILAATQDKGVVPRDEIDIDIKSSDASVLSYKIIEKGNFVISLRSFQGGIEYSNYEGICSPAYTVLKVIKPIDTGFYKAYLKTNDFIQRLSSTVIGIRDGKQISYQAFSTLMIDYPCLEEQTKIANFLSSIDQKIEVVAQQIEQAKLWKKGLLQQMFV